MIRSNKSITFAVRLVAIAASMIGLVLAVLLPQAASAACTEKVYHRIVASSPVERAAAYTGWEATLVEYDQQADCTQITTPYVVKDAVFDHNTGANEAPPAVGLVTLQSWPIPASVDSGEFFSPKQQWLYGFKYN